MTNQIENQHKVQQSLQTPSPKKLSQAVVQKSPFELKDVEHFIGKTARNLKDEFVSNSKKFVPDQRSRLEFATGSMNQTKIHQIQEQEQMKSIIGDLKDKGISAFKPNRQPGVISSQLNKQTPMLSHHSDQLDDKQFKLAKIMALSIQKQGSTVQRKTYQSPRSKKKNLVQAFNRGQRAQNNSVNWSQVPSAAKRGSVISEVPSVVFDPAESMYQSEMMIDSQKRPRESPFTRDPPSKQRRFSRFSGIKSNDQGSARQGSQRRSGSRSPPISPFSKKLTTRSSAKVLEQESEEYDSEYDEEEDYRAIFSRDQRRNRKKYIISAKPTEIVEQMDEMIQEKIAQAIGLRSKKEGIENSFQMSQIAQSNNQMAALKALKEKQKLENSIISKVGLELQKTATQKNKKIDRNRNLQLIKEIRDEDQIVSQQRADAQEQANGQDSQDLTNASRQQDHTHEREPCLIKQKAKNYIRHLRNLEIRAESRDQEGQPHVVCHHDLPYDFEESRLLVFMIWFAEFQKQLASSIKYVKIGKDQLFEAFITLLLSSKEVSPILKEMQAYIKENRPEEKQSQMMNLLLYDYGNQYMIMKSKNPQFESDTDEESLDQQDTNFKLYDSELKQSKDQGILRNLSANINIEISQDLYKKFLDDLGRVEKRPSKNFSSGSIIQDSKSSQNVSTHELSRSKIKQSIEKGLDSVIKCLTETQEKIEDVSAQQPKKGQPQPEVDEHIDTVKQALERNLKRQLDSANFQKEELMQAKTKLIFTPRKLESDANKKNVWPALKNLALSRREPVHPSNMSLVQDELKKEATKNPNVLKVGQEQQAMKEYNETAKLLVGQPSATCGDDEPSMTYYRHCKKVQISTNPAFINQLKDKCLKIENEYMSVERCYALRELLQKGFELEKPEYEIEELVVDEQSMDDQKLAIILGALASQPGKYLKRICIRNCELKFKALEPMVKILERTAPNHIEELRLVNLKGLDLLQKGVTGPILEEIAGSQELQILHLSRLTLDENNLVMNLCEVISGNRNLRELDLSLSKMSVSSFGFIMESLKQNETIKILSLKGINLMNLTSQQQEIDQQYPDEQLDALIIPKPGGQSGHIRGDDHRRIESTRQSLADLVDFITYNNKLQHLDLSYMALGDKIIEICDAITLNQSILAVHLGNNYMSQRIFEEILIKFGIDKKNLAQNGMIDNINQMRQQSIVRNVVKDAFQEYFGEGNNTEQQRQISSHNSTLEFDLGKNEKGLVHHEIQKDLDKKRASLRASLQDGMQRAPLSHHSQLVLTRKPFHPELVYNEMPQSSDQLDSRLLDFESGQQKWALDFDDRACYFCNKYPYVQIFYRRCKADSEFEEITNESEKRTLKERYKISNDTKGFGKIPQIFGSIMQRQSDTGTQTPPLKSGMILAKHYAALLFVQEETQRSQNHSNVSEIQSNLRKGIIKMIKNQISLDNRVQQIPYELDNHLKSLLCAWRELVLPTTKIQQTPQSFQHQCHDCELVVNHPHFDEQFQDEDDIFVFSGYVEPGKHHFYVYDPETGRMYSKRNVIVYPRNKEIKQKSENKNLETQQSLIKTSANFKAAQAIIYGDLLSDLNPKMVEFTFKKDIEALQAISLNLITSSISKQVEREFVEIMQFIMLNYKVVIEMHKFIHIQNISSGNATGVMSSLSQSRFSEILGEALQDQSSLTQSDFDQTFENVQKSFKKSKSATKHDRVSFSRKKLLLGLIRLSQLIYERNTLQSVKKGLKLVFASLKSYLRQGNKIQVQKSIVAFNSKPLMNVLLQHREAIEQVYHHQFLFSHRFQTFTLTQGLKEMFSKLMEFKNEQTDEQPQLIPKSFLTLCFLARQAQGFDKHEDLGQGSENSIENSLSQEEFILLLVNIAVHQSREAPQEDLPQNEVVSPRTQNSLSKEPEISAMEPQSPIIEVQDEPTPSILPLTSAHLLEGQEVDYSGIALRVQELIALLSGVFLNKEIALLEESQLLGDHEQELPEGNITKLKTQYFGKQESAQEIFNQQTQN